MLENRLMELLEKKIITLEELQEIEEHEQVTNVENCGNSGKNIGYIWYNVATEDGEEHDIYCK